MAIFTNQARLTYNGLSVNSNIVTGEFREELVLSKNALKESYRMGETVVYAVSILNEGATDLSDLTARDDLGGYMSGADVLYPLSYVSGSVRYYVNGILQPAPDVTVDPALAFSGISVPAGGNAMLLYETRVTEFASPVAGAFIRNTVTLFGEDLPSSASASETIFANSDPSLSILKSLSPLSVSENDQLTYTFVLSNNGSQAADAGDMVSVIDVFAPILSDIEVTLDGAPFTAYSYDQTTGTFVTTPGSISVPGATYVQDPVSGVWQIDPGAVILAVRGTV